MAGDLNQCNFIGRLGKDPESRYTAGGDAVCNFSVAVGEKWKKDGELQEKTEWVRITTFGKLAEICVEYLKKGSKIFISGKMQTRKWQNKDGVDQYTTEIVANQMQMLDGKPRESDDGEAPTRQQQTRREPAKRSNADDLDDDIPF